MIDRGFQFGTIVRELGSMIIFHTTIVIVAQLVYEELLLTKIILVELIMFITTKHIIQTEVGLKYTKVIISTFLITKAIIMVEVLTGEMAFTCMIV
jgi:hypothetical protein